LPGRRKSLRALILALGLCGCAFTPWDEAQTTAGTINGSVHDDSGAPVPDADLTRQREVVAAFLAAARAGDFEALVEVLDPDAVFNVDAGGVGPRAREPVKGAAAVAKMVLARGARFAPQAQPALVNGAAGLIVDSDDGPIAVIGFTVVGGRIVELDLILDRAKLERLRPGRD